MTDDESNIYLQWKGTDACFDFWCDCGTGTHHDGMFIYFVKCPSCGSVYEMPYNLTAKKVDLNNPPDHYVSGEERIGVL